MDELPDLPIKEERRFFAKYKNHLITMIIIAFIIILIILINYDYISFTKKASNSNINQPPSPSSPTSEIECKGSFEGFTITLLWDPSLQEVEGYKINIGTNPKKYTKKIDVGKSNEYSLKIVTDGESQNVFPGRLNFFALTSYDQTESETLYSKEAIYLMPSIQRASCEIKDNKSQVLVSLPLTTKADSSLTFETTIDPANKDSWQTTNNYEISSTEKIAENLDLVTYSFPLNPNDSYRYFRIKSVTIRLQRQT